MKYQVWRLGDDEDEAITKEIEGVDTYDAARNWARWYDAKYGDYLIAKGANERIWVTNEDGVSREINVSGDCEMVAYYYATSIRGEDER